jgi:hypothetical protein
MMEGKKIYSVLIPSNIRWLAWYSANIGRKAKHDMDPGRPNAHPDAPETLENEYEKML